MQRLEREGRVAHPGVAVVPVALAAGSLGQRGRQRRHGRAGRHVGEPLDRERGALDRLTEAMVGNPGPPEPVAPEARRGRHPRLRLTGVLRRVEPFRPRESAEGTVAGVQRMASARPAALDAEGKVGHEPDRQAGCACVRPRSIALDELPLGRRSTVVEHRLAHELDLDRRRRCTRPCEPACGRRRRPPVRACAA